MARLEDFFSKSSAKIFSTVSIGIDRGKNLSDPYIVFVDTNVDSEEAKTLRVQETYNFPNPEQRVAQIALDLHHKGYKIRHIND
jgi:hypothetical protein